MRSLLTPLGRYASAVTAAATMLAATAARAAEDVAEAEASGLPQLDFNTWPTQLFWTAVIFSSLYFVMARIALPRVSEILETRQTRIEHDLERASELKSEYDQVHRAVEQDLAVARDKAGQEVAKILERSARDAEKKQAELAKKMEKELSAAEARIAKARTAAIANIGEAAADTAAAAVERLIGAKVDKRRLNAAVDAAIKARA